MAAIGNLYFKTWLTTRVSLFPEQITGDIMDNLLTNLKRKVEKKTVEEGIVVRVERMKLLEDGDEGIVNRINFTGTTDYKITYECVLCAPLKEIEITAKLTKIIPEMMIFKNGPIQAVTMSGTNTASNIFENIDGRIRIINKKSPLKYLQIGSFVKLTIINYCIDPDTQNIVCQCYLSNLPSDKEISKFKKEQQLFNGVEDDDDDNEEFI